MTGQPTEPWPFSGYLLALASVLFYFLATSFIPYMDQVPVLQVTCFRLVIQTVITTPVVLITKATFFGESGDRFYIFLRGAMSSIVLLTTYAAIYLMPLADSLTILFTAPAVVTIMAFFILKEPCDLFQIILVVVSITGAVLVAQPSVISHGLRQLFDTTNDVALSSTSNITSLNSTTPTRSTTNDFSQRYTVSGRVLGTAYSFIGVICMASVYILLRKLQNVPASTVLFVYSFSGGVLFAIPNFFFGWNFNLSPIIWIFQILIGVFGAFAQLFLICALKFESAAPVSIIRSLEIVLAFLYQTFWMEVYPNVFSIIGAILVTSSAVGHGIRKMVKEKDSHEPLN